MTILVISASEAETCIGFAYLLAILELSVIQVVRRYSSAGSCVSSELTGITEDIGSKAVSFSIASLITPFFVRFANIAEADRAILFTEVVDIVRVIRHVGRYAFEAATITIIGGVRWAKSNFFWR